MPQLVYNPTYYPILDTHEVTAVGLRALFYDPVTPEQSLSIINGLLDNTNLASGVTILPEHTQRGSMVDAWMVSGTANLDYLYRVFSDFDSSITFDRAAATTSTRQPIPGGAVTFFVPTNPTAEQSLVRLSWTVSWTNDNDANIAYDTKIVLAGGSAIDPTEDILEGQWRQVNRTIAVAGDDDHEGYSKSRVWSGHCYVRVSAGWHTYSLCILQDNRIKQSRVWARSINAVVFYG